MPVEPGETPPPAVRPKAKVIDDGPVVVEVDGFALMTPEQRTWPVYSARPGRRAAPDPAAVAPDGAAAEPRVVRPGSRPVPGKPSHDRSDFYGVLDNPLDPDPRFDDWPALGEPPVVIEPFGIKVSRVDTSGLGGTWWPADRPHSRQWSFDASEVKPGIGAVSFSELERLVPAATRAARAARAAAAELPTGPGTAPAPAG